MKDIIFGGKTLPKENKDHEFDSIWVYGDLITNGGKYYIHPRNNIFRTENEIVNNIFGDSYKYTRLYREFKNVKKSTN